MSDTRGKFEVKRNLGAVDRVIRGIIGIALILLAYQRIIAGGLATIATIVGVILFVESLVAY